MQHPKDYQALFDEMIFFGGASCVVPASTNEGIDVIVDLRAEVQAPDVQVDSATEWVHVPIAEGQEAYLLQAIEAVVTAYQQGKKVYFH